MNTLLRWVRCLGIAFHFHAPVTLNVFQFRGGRPSVDMPRRAPELLASSTPKPWPSQPRLTVSLARTCRDALMDKPAADPAIRTSWRQTIKELSGAK